MIANDRQYRITKAEARRFEEALEAATKDRVAKSGERLHRAMIEGLESQLDELREDLARYEALRAGEVRRRTMSSLNDLPIALIEARIAARMTQKQLGVLLGLAEQQIQRYEATGYAGVSVERAQEVVDALGVTIKKEVRYAVPATSVTTRSRRSQTRPEQPS